MTIGMFIDGAYASNVYPRPLDFSKFRVAVEAELGDQVDEAYYFNADDDPPKATKFNHFLTVPPPKGPGFRIKIYWLTRKKLFWPHKLGDHPVIHPTIPDLQFEIASQKGVDVGLAFHMVRSFYRRKWNKLVLFAGDGDFHEPIQTLVEGENVGLYIVGSLQKRTISSELMPYGKIIEIDQEPWLSRVSR
jgi:uncharacterized LabA/DUF88 family protein